MDIDKVALVDAWIRRYTLPKTAEVDAETEWAYDELDEICDKDPHLCLEIIESICVKTESDWVRSNLGSGPLEDLLARHGESVIAAVEEKARGNRDFRDLLSAVWQNVMSEDVWARVQRAADG